MVKQTDLQIFQDKIEKHWNKLWIPSIDLEKKSIDTNSWFTTNIATSPNEHETIIPSLEKQPNQKIINSFQVRLLLTETQKMIINSWLKMYIRMYNETIKFIKKDMKIFIVPMDKYYKKLFNQTQKFKKLTSENALDFLETFCKINKVKNNCLKHEHDKFVANRYMEYIKNHDNLNCDWMFVRSELKNKKEQIIGNSKVHSHTLDGAIKLACANFSSALTNFKNGNIKFFRIRYWKENKSQQILSLEKTIFQNGNFCKNILGNVIAKYETNGKWTNFDFAEIDCDCKLIYYAEEQEYYLNIPRKVLQNKSKPSHKVIAIDLGLRTFGTGISENEVVEYGVNMKQHIEKYNKKIKDVNEDYGTKRKKKIKAKYRRKIRNKIDDMHWKIIKDITTNYENIIIGDLSAKKIVSKKGNMTKSNKRFASALRIYQFRQRLEYKCKLEKRNYKLIPEGMTTKVCSKCKTINWDIGKKKIFYCKGCGMKIDRDVNSGRNMFIKAF